MIKRIPVCSLQEANPSLGLLLELLDAAMQGLDLRLRCPSQGVAAIFFGRLVLEAEFASPNIQVFPSILGRINGEIPSRTVYRAQLDKMRLLIAESKLRVSSAFCNEEAAEKVFGGL